MPPPRTNHLTPVTNTTGRLLCWSLGGAMLVNTAQAVAHPDLLWWRALWIGLWALTALLLLVWAALRTLEKDRFRQETAAGGHGMPTDTVWPDDGGGYDQAA